MRTAGRSAGSKVLVVVRILLDSLRAQPGDPAAIRSPGFRDARRSLAAFLNDPGSGCQAGSESGSG